MTKEEIIAAYQAANNGTEFLAVSDNFREEVLRLKDAGEDEAAHKLAEEILQAGRAGLDDHVLSVVDIPDRTSFSINYLPSTAALSVLTLEFIDTSLAIYNVASRGSVYMKLGLYIRKALERARVQEHRPYRSDLFISTFRSFSKLHYDMKKRVEIFKVQFNDWIEWYSYYSWEQVQQEIFMNPNIDRTFLQARDKNYYSRDGWVMKWIEKTIKIGDTDHVEGDYYLFKPNGEQVEHWSFQNAPSNMFFISYQDRYGRSGDTLLDMKFGPEHFPAGTVVEIKGSMIENGIFTVAAVYEIEARNWVLDMVETRPSIMRGARVMEPASYNIAHVYRIVKRGTGHIGVIQDLPTNPAYRTERKGIESFREYWQTRHLPELMSVCEDFELPIPKAKKGEYITVSPQNLVNLAVGCQGFIPGGHWIDETRAFRHFIAMGFLRQVGRDDPHSPVGFYALDYKRASKWLQKNYHRCMFNLDYVCKEIEEDDRRQSESYARTESSF